MLKLENISIELKNINKELEICQCIIRNNGEIGLLLPVKKY